MRVSLAGAQYKSAERQIYFYKQLLNRLSGLVDVPSVGAIDCLPTCTDTVGGSLHFTDRSEPPENDPALVVIGSISPDYFRAMRIPLIRGRYFSESDGEYDQPVVILDEQTVRRYWPNRDPIGRHIRLRSKWPLRKIVGVVGNVDHKLAVKMKSGIGQAYVPFTQMPYADMSLAISSPMTTDSLIPSVRREISALAPDQPVFQVRTMGQARAATQISSEFGTCLLGCFAMISLLLAAIGVYGVIYHTVEHRTREFGVRIALGATPSDLLFAVLTKGVVLTLIGLVLGLIASLMLSATMKDLLNGLSPTDPLSLAATVLVLTGTAILATFIPAFRASRVVPMIALRQE
jgi:predicted permease